MVLLVGSLNQVAPLLPNLVDHLLVFRRYLVLIHFKHSELFLRFANLELHVHRNIFNFSDFVEKSDEQINAFIINS